MDSREKIPARQTDMVRALVKGSGEPQELISRKSEDAAKVYACLCPRLPDRLTPPTISRMVTGSVLKKLKRRNLLLLHLTIHYIRDLERKGGGADPRAVEAAAEFADTVLLAGSGSRQSEDGFYNPTDPRHHRTVDLFGEYGISLIGYAIAQDDAPSFRKLAVLQWLSGNRDDARYWGSCADKAASEPLKALNDEVAAQEASAAGHRYLYNGQREVAEIYLACAAEAGHPDAAFRLGDVLEVLQRNEEAQHWYSMAQSLGSSEAGIRLTALQGALENA